MSLATTESRANNRMRVAARTMLAIFASVTIFVLFTQGPRRFLPRSEREFCLDLSRDEWGAVSVRDPRIDGVDPASPPYGVTRFIMREHSMGRTNPFYSEWRVSNWNIWMGLNANGMWFDESDGPLVSSPDAREALVKFVEERVIPDSQPMRFWPDTDGHIRRQGEQLWWTMSQRRELILPKVFYTAACIGAGTAVSFLLVWPKRRIAPIPKV